MKENVYVYVLYSEDGGIEGIYSSEQYAIAEGIKGAKEILKEIFEDDTETQKKELKEVILDLQSGGRNLYYIKKYPFSFFETIIMMVTAISKKK